MFPGLPFPQKNNGIEKFGVIFLDPFLDNFWTTFMIILDAKIGKRGGQKVDSFLEPLLGASWSCLGGLLGCLEALLGGPVFQKQYKKQYKTHLFKNVSFRCLSSFRAFLGAILGNFWAVLDIKMEDQNQQKRVPKVVPCLVSFWVSFGSILGTFLRLRAGPSAPAGDQK